MSLFGIDFTQQMNQVFIVIYFVIAVFLTFMKQNLFAGSMFLFGGMLMALNDINVIISIMIMALGVIIITTEQEEF